MTTYETGRYDMCKRVCRFGEAHPQFFPEGSGARQTFAQRTPRERLARRGRKRRLM